MAFRRTCHRRRRLRLVHALESRLLLAAHIAGDSTVYSTIHDVVLTLDANNSVTLLNSQLASLSSGDFVFG